MVAGIINLGPEPHGKPPGIEESLDIAIGLERAGVDIIDLVADPFEAGLARPVEGEELRRVVPLLKKLKEATALPICVTTARGAVAAKAAEHGAEIIHDPSGLTFEPDLAKVANENDLGLIVSHVRGQPADWPKQPPLADVVRVVMRELIASGGRALHAGVQRGRLMLDPGLGQGKRREQNATLLAQLHLFADTVMPISCTPTRLQLLAKQSTEELVDEVSITAAILGGAHLVRLHQAARLLAAVQAADLIVDQLPPDRIVRPQPKPRDTARD